MCGDICTDSSHTSAQPSPIPPALLTASSLVLAGSGQSQIFQVSWSQSRLMTLLKYTGLNVSNVHRRRDMWIVKGFKSLQMFMKAL